MDDSNSSSTTGDSPCHAITKRKRTKRRSALSAAVSSASSGMTVNEEEDMANCLILLAQGRTLPAQPTAGVYDCKTCGKRFPSFQALGGHRASHKKPKLAVELPGAASKSMAFLSITAGGKTRSHECSICGAEFSSGQALGGHMRRHRPVVFPEVGGECKRRKSGFSLDLNLPAPGEDEHFGGGGGGGNSLVFSPAVALVNCYY